MNTGKTLFARLMDFLPGRHLLATSSATQAIVALVRLLVASLHTLSKLSPPSTTTAWRQPE